MSRNDYFKRVNALTPTRFWVNNPTRSQAKMAIEAGAVCCTTNPTHAIKIVRSAEDGEIALQIIDKVLSDKAHSVSDAAALVQRQLVKMLLDEFADVYEKSHGRLGYVSIQCDPHAESDPDNIIREALADLELNKNVIAKIPITKPGLEAVYYLVKKNVPVIATEIMSMSQMIAACETYQKASEESSCQPAFFVTHITGIYDEYLQKQAAAGKIQADPDALYQAGTIIARKQLGMMHDKGYPGIMLGGGARGLHHFTEMVGGAMHVTINWAGTADKLIELDPPVVSRMQTPTPDSVLEELLYKVPAFEKAYRADGLDIDEFADFGPVELFRSQFLKGWDDLIAVIQGRV